MDAPAVQYVTTSDGYSIAYAVTGPGRPYVLLPGAFEHVQLAWQYPKLYPWLEAISARFQLIQLDERGAGMSTRGLKEDHAVEDYQLDIEAVIDRLNPAPFVLHATTTRSLCAVQFALDHPERVSALVLGAARPWGAYRTTQAAFFNTLPDADWDLFARSLVGQYQASEDLPKSLALFNQAFEPHDFAKRMRVAGLGIPEDSLSRLRTPTLVLSPRDYWTGEGTSAMMMKVAQLARATFTVIDGTFALGDSEQGIRAIEAFLAALPETPSPESPQAAAGLSSREIEVLRLVAAGRGNQQIADELVISLNTVRRHVSNIFDKTGVANRAQAAIYARDKGLA
jgi:DNA-binding CsgD family transcriptional regulator/pimeloyl-ACP methyl ester carboxylesterase